MGLKPKAFSKLPGFHGIAPAKHLGINQVASRLINGPDISVSIASRCNMNENGGVGVVSRAVPLH